MSQQQNSPISRSSFPKGNRSVAFALSPPSNSAGSSSSQNSSTSSDSDDDIAPAHEEVYRIQTCLDYVRERHQQGRNPEAMIRFTIPRSLDILRAAVDSGEAVSICRDVDTETFEIGARPLPQPFPSGIAPNWFEGATPEEMRAGPLASPGQIKRVRTAMKATATRRKNAIKKNGDVKTGRTRREIEIEEKLEEGYRRQLAKEKKRGRLSSSSSSSSSSASGSDSDESRHEEQVQAQSPKDDDNEDDESDEEQRLLQDIDNDDEGDSTHVEYTPPCKKKAAAAAPRAGRQARRPATKVVSVSSDSESESSDSVPPPPPRRAQRGKAPVSTRKRRIVDSDDESDDEQPVNKKRKIAPGRRQARKAAPIRIPDAPRAPPSGRKTRSGREY